MEEYSDKELEQVCEKTDKWFDQFSKSPFFDGLTEEQKEKSGFIIFSFTEYMYNYHSRTPEDWDERGLEECCLETLPRKITADESYYRSIASVLSAFFNFTEKEGLLKNSSNLAKKVKKIGKQIVINSNDPSNWGMAKSFMMSAKRNGVNLENKRQMEEYIMDYNSRQIQSPHIPSRLIQSMKTQMKEKSKVGRNDQCRCGSGKKYKKCCGR